MGNTNKDIEYKKKSNKIIDEEVSDEINAPLNKSNIIKLPFDSDLISENDSEDILNQTLIQPKEDKCLDEFEDEFLIDKLIRTGLISKIYKAENIKEHRKVCLKVFDKKNLEKGDYDFFWNKLIEKKKLLNYVNVKI